MGENQKTAVYIGKISNGTTDVISISEIAGYAEKIPHVRAVWLASNTLLIDVDHLKKMIKDNDINRIIIAGHEPGMYKPFFARAMVGLGLNPDDIILADFGEYGAYKRADTELAKAIVACAVWDVPFNLAADPGEYDVNPETLVIGGGIAGIQASLEIADGNNKVYGFPVRCLKD